VLHEDNSGDATFVFSTGSAGTYTSDYRSGAWSTVAPVPSVPPYFQNGFTAFAQNENGDVAVVGLGSDLRAVRRVAGSGVWGVAETIPAPFLPPNTVAAIDNAAIGAGGDLVVSMHTLTTNCSPNCVYSNLTLYAASEGQAGGGWTLSKPLSSRTTGSYMASQPFVDAAGHTCVVSVAQYGGYLDLKVVTQSAPTARWSKPVTIMKQKVKSGRHTTLLNLIGAEADATGDATVVFGSGIVGIPGTSVSSADGNIVSKTWASPVVLASNVAPNGVHYASNAVGGIALAWDNPDAPIAVLSRAATGDAWGAIEPVGSPNCGSQTTICTQVLSLSLDDNGKQKILFDDSSSQPGGVYYAESF
jgi:hypothetical protein